MAVLDKWQQREAQQHAKDNGVSYGEAVNVLFPNEDEQAAPAEEVQEETPAPKVSTVKAGGK